jgi:hypothetical protein
MLGHLLVDTCLAKEVENLDDIFKDVNWLWKVENSLSLNM